jgi:hypothetical protein
MIEEKNKLLIVFMPWNQVDRTGKKFFIPRVHLVAMF